MEAENLTHEKLDQLLKAGYERSPEKVDRNSKHYFAIGSHPIILMVRFPVEPMEWAKRFIPRRRKCCQPVQDAKGNCRGPA